MGKIGRNDLCSCGSGLQFKNCCIDKSETEVHAKFIANRKEKFVSYNEVNKMSTSEIINKLKGFGIPFDTEEFSKDVEKYYSAEQIFEHWYDTYNVTIVGRDDDFPWFAAWILWERLAPKHILSMEQLSNLLDKGYEYLQKNDLFQGFDSLFKFWNALKYRIKPESKNLDYLNEQYMGSFFISNFSQDFAMDLYNAGYDNAIYFENCITFCREFCHYFPDEDELIVHNMRRWIGDSLVKLKKDEEAIEEFN